MARKALFLVCTACWQTQSRSKRHAMTAVMQRWWQVGGARQGPKHAWYTPFVSDAAVQQCKRRQLTDKAEELCGKEKTAHRMSQALKGSPTWLVQK